MKPRSRAHLVILQTKERSSTFLQDSLNEVKELAASASVTCLGATTSNIKHPSPRYYLREGKLNEIGQDAKTEKADVLIFNVDLSPAQARNIEQFTKIPTMDRTGLILDIFGKRAQSKEGKLQVELARLNYVLPRLGGLGGVMSRLGGGVGTRGPGEQELEWDRRKIRKRIQRVKEELEKVRKHRELIRAGRKRKNFISIAIVGYTNAGKSTLLNALTGAGTYVRDKVFATLDPKAKLQSMDGRRDILFVDTVGFIQDLPHTLVESFHATLEEVEYSDAVIHVLDGAHPHAVEYKRAVENVLKEIHAYQIPRILVLNKADLMNEGQRKTVQAQWSEGVLISAKLGLGMHSLLAKVDELFTKF